MSTPRGYTVYWYNPRFLNWGPGPELYGQGMYQYVFHPWEIRTQTLYCALSRGCLAHPSIVGLYNQVLIIRILAIPHGLVTSHFSLTDKFMVIGHRLSHICMNTKHAIWLIGL